MIIWSIWFLTWLAVGFSLFQVVRKAARKRFAFSPRSYMMLVWILFSAGAAEIIRAYLIMAPFSPLVWAMAGLAVGIIGATVGLAAGWFIGGRSFGKVADMLVGMLGALVAAWGEITLSYNYLGCGLAVVFFGAALATLSLRLYARSKTPFAKSERTCV